MWGVLSWLSVWSGIQVASGFTEFPPEAYVVWILYIKDTFLWYICVSGLLIIVLPASVEILHLLPDLKETSYLSSDACPIYSLHLQV